MANHKSALKRIRQNEKRNQRNRVARSTLRTTIKTTLKAIEAGEIENAEKSAKQATSLLDKAVVHGLLHKNNAKRKISRLNKKVSAAKA